MKTYKKPSILCLIVALLFLSFAGSTKAATLSQSSISLSVGQSSTVYAYNVSTSLYLSNNSNYGVATVSVNGTSINIYAVAIGSTTATICDGSYGCNTMYITVNSNGNYNGSLSLSQTNLSLSVGQTSVVTAYNYYNNYSSYGTLYISSNSNPSVATTYINGSSISIYASTYGNTTITVCQNNGTSSCGSIYVSVTGGGYYPYNQTSTSGLNISSLTIPVGGKATVSSVNSTGTYVSNNPNPSVATTSNSSAVSGCSTNSLYSTITGQPCGGGSYYNSSSYYNNSSYNSSIPGCYGTSQYSVLTGQSCYNNYNNGSYYNSSYISGCYGTSRYSILTGQLCYNNGYNNGQIGSNSVDILGVSAGSDTITFCQNSGIACSIVYVTVY